MANTQSYKTAPQKLQVQLSIMTGLKLESLDGINCWQWPKSPQCPVSHATFFFFCLPLPYPRPNQPPCTDVGFCSSGSSEPSFWSLGGAMTSREWLCTSSSCRSVARVKMGSSALIKHNEENSGQWTIRLHCFLCNFPSVYLNNRVYINKPILFTLSVLDGRYHPTCYMQESEGSAPPWGVSWRRHTCREFSAQPDHLLVSTKTKTPVHNEHSELYPHLIYSSACFSPILKKKINVPEGWQCRVWAFCLLVCSCTTEKCISSAPERARGRAQRETTRQNRGSLKKLLKP